MMHRVPAALVLLFCLAVKGDFLGENCAMATEENNLGEDEVFTELCSTQQAVNALQAKADQAGSCKSIADELITGFRSIVEQLAEKLLSVGDFDVEKRKNEFVRFGKRKNEFVRFGKRKNEFVRFGKKSGGSEKRKNEFVRFG